MVQKLLEEFESRNIALVLVGNDSGEYKLVSGNNCSP
jgi:hypothetical protein